MYVLFFLFKTDAISFHEPTFLWYMPACFREKKGWKKYPLAQTSPLIYDAHDALCKITNFRKLMCGKSTKPQNETVVL